LVSVFENPRRPLHALPSRSVKKPPAFPARPNAILVSFAVALLTLSGDINWKNYRHWIKKMRNFLSFPIKSYYCLQFKLQTMKKRIPPRRFSILSYLLITLLVPNLFAQRNQSDTFRTQAEVFFNEGNNVKAMEYYQKAFQAAYKKDVNRTANLCVDISTVYYTESKYEAATQKCWEGLKMLPPSAPDSLFFKCYSSLGEMYKKRYLTDSSLYFFQKANALADSKPALLKQIPDYVLYSYNNQSRFYFLNEDYGQGIALFNKAIEVSKKLNKKDDAAILSNNIAEYYEILGDYSKAFQSRQNAVKRIPKKIFPSAKCIQGWVGMLIY
jgi:tetratricopeptide (TPR) repeat protein